MVGTVLAKRDVQRIATDSYSAVAARVYPASNDEPWFGVLMSGEVGIVLDSFEVTSDNANPGLVQLGLFRTTGAAGPTTLAEVRFNPDQAASDQNAFENLTILGTRQDLIAAWAWDQIEPLEVVLPTPVWFTTGGGGGSAIVVTTLAAPSGTVNACCNFRWSETQ